MTTAPIGEHGLGRIWIPDDRDRGYPLSAVVPVEEEKPTYRYWYPNGWWGDQGATPQCVAYSLLHFISDGPYQGRDPAMNPRMLYCEAQQHDPWEGDCSNPLYDGTSVRAGAKVLKDRGFISSYTWAFNLDTVVDALLLDGPVVLGTNWYDGMFNTDRNGFIHPTGAVRGGHAYIVNGVNVRREVVRIKNSWGRSWGVKGYAWMTFGTLGRLLAEQGDACSPRR